MPASFGGPRQVGKTTMAKQVLEMHGFTPCMPQPMGPFIPCNLLSPPLKSAMSVIQMPSAC